MSRCPAPAVHRGRQLLLLVALALGAAPPARAQVPDEQLYIHVHWDADHTSAAGNTCSAAGAVGGPTTVRIRLLKPQIPMSGAGAEITINEVAGHAADPDEHGNVAFTAGPWHNECGDPDPDPNHLYASYDWPSQFNNHNGPHTIYVKVVYGLGALPNVQQVVLEKTITVDVQNLAITSTTPNNPEPLKWKPDEMEFVPVSATIQAAYCANREVTLEIFNSEQGVVRTLQQTVPLGGAGASAVSFQWDGKDNAGVECPRGLYTFRFNMLVPGWAHGDQDSDKSGILSVSQAEWKAHAYNTETGIHTLGPHYVLTDTANPRSDASEAKGWGFNPDLVAFGDPSPAPGGVATNPEGAQNPTWNDATFQASFQTPGQYWYVAAAKDDHAVLDKGHRQRWALPRGKSPVHPLAVNYDFQNFPPPVPPYGSTPYATVAKNWQRQPGPDGSFYVSHAYTNNTANAAAGQLPNAAIFYVFGHGGDQGVFMKQYQRFWDGTNWSFIVETPLARQEILASKPPDAVWHVVVLQELEDGALDKVLLAVFQGCRTGYWNATYGSPVRGAVAKGARVALGFRHLIGDPGAKLYAGRLWQHLNEGLSVERAHSRAAHGLQPYGLGQVQIEGDRGLTIHPARYGDQP